MAHSSYVGMHATYHALPDAVSHARKITMACLTYWELDHIADDAAIIVSELVTNAVAVSGGLDVDEPPMHPMKIGFTLFVYGGRLIISVTDRSLEVPRMRQASNDELGGRGLLLVKELAETWGYTPKAHGKSVWARLKTV